MTMIMMVTMMMIDMMMVDMMDMMMVDRYDDHDDDGGYDDGDDDGGYNDGDLEIVSLLEHEELAASLVRLVPAVGKLVAP